jgi:peptidoglycan hydrolase-like protein with peptidoglycan-binding domain
MPEVDVTLRLPILRSGGEHPPNIVGRIQEMLTFIGRLEGLAADDDFGPKTEQAVKDFQQNQDPPLAADGIVGEQTWSVLLTRWLFGISSG